MREESRLWGLGSVVALGRGREKLLVASEQNDAKLESEEVFLALMQEEGGLKALTKTILEL